MQGESSDSDWDRVHERIATHSAEVARILAMVDASSPRRVLDLACGTGKHLLEFAQLGHQCTGIDRLDWKLQIARADSQALGLDVDFVCGDLCGFEAAPTHDLVICLYALSCMVTDEDLLAALATATGALAPGGAFVFNAINAEARGQAQFLGPDATGNKHIRSFTVDELERFLTHVGLKLQACALFDIEGVERFDIFMCTGKRS